MKYSVRSCSVAALLLLTACGGESNFNDANTDGLITKVPVVPNLGNENIGNSNGTDINGPGGIDPADPSFSRDCFWVVQNDPSVINVLYPDAFATYWVASFDIPVGGKVLLKGEFPHARYSSLHIYNPILQPLDAIADSELVPDVGSVNVSQAGADRTATNRSWTTQIIAAVPPENLNDREDNTLYSFQGRNGNNVPSQRANVFYRVYIEDNGRDVSGDVGLPTVVLVDATGNETTGTDACSVATTLPAPSTLNDIRQGDDSISTVPSSTAFQTFNISWLRFFNFQGSQANRFSATPAGEPLIASPLNSPSSAGGFASNVHNAYLYAQLSHKLEDNNPLTRLVGAFEMQVPTTPKTRNGNTNMDSAEVRYWSVITNENNQQAYVDGVYDEDSVAPLLKTTSGAIKPDLAAANRRIFLVSRPGEERPNNAIEACGVNWLSWGFASDSIVILRNMLADSSFPQAIQQIPPLPGQCEEPIMNPNYSAIIDAQKSEQNVQGSFFPYGTHMTKIEFEALGCPIVSGAISSISAQNNRVDCEPNNP
jgi:hypothetical protein